MRIDYLENDHCCQRFALADDWLRARGLLAEGPVGHGTARLFRARDVVRLAVANCAETRSCFCTAPARAVPNAVRPAKILWPSYPIGGITDGGT